MKTNKIFMLAIAAGAMFLGSCSNDDGLKQIDEAAKPGTMVFTATMENAGEATRTVLGGTNSTDVYWSSGDTITIFNSGKTSGAKFTATDAGGTSATCTFSGDISSANPYYAVYPAQTGATLSGTAINGVTLPANQTAVAGSYDPAAALMVAKSNTTDLQFKNLNTLIKITPEFDCTKIIFDAGSIQIAGKVNVFPNASSDPTWDATGTAGDAKNVVTLSGNIQADLTYYIAILPNITLPSFTITFCAVESDASGNLGFKKEKSTSYTFARNKIVNFGTFEKSDLTVCKYAGQPDVNKPIVDLGLPSGLCWAKYNVGYVEETKPYGDYFSWGYTEPLYDSYTFTSTTSITDIQWKSGLSQSEGGYCWGNYSYNTTGAASGETIEGGSGKPYTNGVLNEANDAATQKMESPVNTEWRTPTKDDIGELRQNTVWVYESQSYGGVSSVAGYKVFRAIDDAHKGYIYMNDSREGQIGYKWFKINTKSATYVYYPISSSASNPNVPDIVTSDDTINILNNAYIGKTAPLFLPSSGCFEGITFRQGGEVGNYWSSTWNTATEARHLYSSVNCVDPQGSKNRPYGRSVRGVCE